MANNSLVSMKGTKIALNLLIMGLSKELLKITGLHRVSLMLYFYLKKNMIVKFD